MNRIAAATATAATAATAVLITSGAFAAGHDPILRLTAVVDPMSVHTTDVGAKGPSAGDLTVFSGSLRSGNRTVGRIQGLTVAADPRYQGDIKTEYLTLRGATIAIVGGGQNRAPGTRTADADIPDAIVGGTGRYAGARGSVTGRDVDDTTMQLTLRIAR